jgi:leader peptidase (prepilin peptidase) / N-methyltransferase
VTAVTEVPDFLLLSLVGVLGGVFGSFANVAIYRVPLGKSVIRPRSACPSCQTSLSGIENVPVLSYVALRGRCRHCQARISVRYPLIELITAGVWVLITMRVGWKPELPAYLIFGTALVILSAIDFEVQRLPNKVLSWASLLGAVLFVAAALVKGDVTPLWHGLIGALAYGVPMFVIGLIAPGGMGFGDVKFAPYLGFHLGWLRLGYVPVGAFLGFLLGAVLGGLLMIVGRAGRKTKIPFGPFMAMGAFVTIFFGDAVLRFWLP